MIILCRRSSRCTQERGFYLLRDSLSAPVFFIVLLCYLIGYCPRIPVGLALSQHNTIGRVFPCCISYLTVFAVYFFVSFIGLIVRCEVSDTQYLLS